MKRKQDELRQIKVTTNYTKYAEGSVLIECGETKVLCTASIEEKVPPFLKNKGLGWISAEYSMLPRSTQQRKMRDSTKGRVDGRSQEIQRLIGRSLRNAVDFKKLGERTIWLDCDVLQADGGTRTTSITGSFIALALAAKKLYDKQILTSFPLTSFVSAISVGIVNERTTLDLCYTQDSQAQIDMNVVMNEKEEFIEVQGTGEKTPFSRQKLNELLDLATKGNREIIQIQKDILGPEITELILGKPAEKRKEEEFLIATGNAHKLSEIGSILEKYHIPYKSLTDYALDGIDVEENGDTFEENALLKAREFCQRTGKATIADDSGIMVDALDGKPGVHSKRFTQEEPRDEKNNEKLLKCLLGLTSDERKAQFVSCLALVYPNGKEYVFRGECPGRIGFSPEGENGFGYDPLFLPDAPLAKGKTFAQISSEIKNTISHRAKALEKFENFLEE